MVCRTIAFAILVLLLGISARPCAPASADQARVRQSVVRLENENREVGTGFVIARSARWSYIMTAAHVLDCNSYGAGCVDTLTASPAAAPGASDRAEIVYSGRTNQFEDIAVVRIERANLPVLSVGTARAGETVAALGYADAAAAAHPKLTTGSIVAVVDSGRRLVMNVATVHGDSGGPVFDEANDTVVGIVHGRSAGGENRLAIGGVTVRLVASHVIAALDAAVKDHADERGAVLRSNAADYCSGELAADTASCWRSLAAAVKAGNLGAALDAVLRAAPTGFDDADPDISGDALTAKIDTTKAALVLCRAAADRNDPLAAYALVTFWDATGGRGRGDPFFGSMKTDEWLRYLRLSAEAGYAPAMSRLGDAYANGNSGIPANGALAQVWYDRADAGFLRLVAQRDARSAYLYAASYQGRVAGVIFNNRLDAAVISDWRKAIELGSTPAIARLGFFLTNGTAQQQVEALGLLKQAAALGNDSAAVAVARYDEKGTFVGQIFENGALREPASHPVDKNEALDYLAQATPAGTFFLATYGATGGTMTMLGSDFLQSKIASLTPGGAAIAATLKSSAAFAAAQKSIARVRLGMLNDTNGVVVWSDGRSAIVAVAAIALKCDTFAAACVTPLGVEIGASTTPYSVTGIARGGDTSIENGFALVAVAAPNATAARLAAAIPDRVITVGYSARSLNGQTWTPEAFWGFRREVSSDQRTMRLVLPRMPQPIIFGMQVDPNGAGIFSADRGELVGLFTQPTAKQRATTSMSIAAALQSVGAK